MTEQLEDLFEAPPVPDGHIPLHAVILVAYLDPDGEKSYDIHVRGTSTIGDVMTLIELGKDDILHTRRRGNNDLE